jgi:hypothetical protein
LDRPLHTICAVPFVNKNIYDTTSKNSSASNDEHDSIKNILEINGSNRNKNQPLENTTLNVVHPTADNIQVWVYVPKNPTPPDASHPILQSYVDIIMRGCFNTIGEPLARSFISTTTGWSRKSNRTPTTPLHHYWVNDRHLPIYKRADRVYSILNAAKIDHVIFDELSSMKNTDIAKYDDDSSSSNHTVAAYYRNTYDPLLHLQQLTLTLEQDYDSVHPMAFQHLASQIQMDHTPRAIVG